MHPSVLLLDEPAAGLSSTESAELARVVRRLADDWGMAILVVEHDMNFVMGVCDQVVVLDFGKLIAAGLARGRPLRSGGDRRLPRRRERRRARRREPRRRRRRRRHRSRVVRHEGAAAGDPQPQGRLPGPRGGARGQPHGPRRRGGLPARPERRGQVDDAADDRRRAGAGRRHRACSTTCRPSRRWTSGSATVASAWSPRNGWCSRRCRPATTCASAAVRSKARWRCSPSSNRGCRCGAGCSRAASSRCWRSPGR